MSLTNKINKFSIMKENQFIEGSALNVFGENFDFEGKKFFSNQNYQIYGTTINYLLENKILNVPNYIKIDVDGIEHIILDGGNKYLNNPNIKSLSIELNENFKEQLDSVFQIMSKNNFNFKQKKHAKSFNSSNKFAKTFNYIFEK